MRMLQPRVLLGDGCPGATFVVHLRRQPRAPVRNEFGVEGVGLPHSELWYGLEAFLKSVLEGEPVVCSAEEGFRSTAVGIAAAHAVTSGEHVDITEEMLRV